MAKRFISTELFDDDWFMDLKPSSKLMWVYFITKCDHAGIISFNERLCKFQTGLTDIESCLKDLKSKIIKISDIQYFIPKFIFFQYPDFPNSKVNQQKGAIKILQKYSLIDDNQQLKITTLNGVLSLSKTYDSVNDTGSDSVDDIDSELPLEDILLEESKEFKQFKGFLEKNCPDVLKMKEPITEDQFNKLKEHPPELIKEILMGMHNKPDLLKKYKSAYLTILTWIRLRENKTPKDNDRIQQSIDVAESLKNKLRGL